MFFSFFFPVYHEKYRHIHIFYNQIYSMGSDNLYALAPDYFFQEISKDALKEKRTMINMETIDWKICNQSMLNSVCRTVYNKEIMDEMNSFSSFNPVIFNYLIENENNKFTDFIINALQDAMKIDTVEAILTIRDCPSLLVAAKKMGIPIIYNEDSPFRKPKFCAANYFNFCGEKNTDEFIVRFQKIQKDLNLKKSCEQWVEKYFPHAFDIPECRKTAVLLGCEDEPVFTGGFTNAMLIRYATQKYGADIVIRQHPADNFINYGKYDYDNSMDTIYLSRICDKAVTQYSNAGVELFIKGLDIEFVGTTPLKFLSTKNMNEDEKAFRLGFYTLNCLIPEKWQYSPEYYRWRLTRPCEQEILERHQAYWESEVNSGNPKKIFDYVH